MKMKILAISDIEDKSLVNAIENSPDRFSTVDCVCSCGDVAKEYLEYVSDGVKKSLYFISGNHFVKDFYGDNMERREIKRKIYSGTGMRLLSGGIDMHGRVETIGDYIIAGFGGSKRYNPGYFQFEEIEMQKLVKKAAKQIRRRHLLDLIMLKKRKEVIVMSHAPVAGVHDKDDVCHSGFKCFRDLIEEFKPLLWMHGHIHPEGQNKKQETMLGETLITNVFSSKIIEIDNCKIFVKHVAS